MCKNSVVLPLPPHLLGTKDGDDVSIDVCIADTIQHLWAAEVATLACCCGHGTDRPNVVINKESEGILDLIKEVDDRPWQVLAWRLVDTTTGEKYERIARGPGPGIFHAEAVSPWVTAWAICEACGHEGRIVRPLTMEAGKGECPNCGEMSCVDNGARWTADELEVSHE